MRRAATAAFLIVALLALPAPGVQAAADRPSGPVSQAELDRAIATKLDGDEAARDQIRRLLQREDVRELARGYGLDARRAEAAVGTLQGEELQRLSAQAAAANAQLAGGDPVIRISLIALLLIIIIVILLAD